MSAFFEQFRAEKAAAPPPGSSPLWSGTTEHQTLPRAAPVYPHSTPSFANPSTHPQPSYGHSNAFGPPTHPPHPVAAPPVFAAFEVRPDNSHTPPPIKYGLPPTQIQHDIPDATPSENFLESAETTFMYTKQLVLEKLGKAQVSELPFVRPKLDKLQQVTAEFEQLVTISERVANNFRNMREAQKDMGEFLKDAASREKETVKDPLYELGSAFMVACHHGEEVLGCLQRLEDTARTFRKAAIEDAYLSAEKYEKARIIYDAARQKVSEMQHASLDPATVRAAQSGLEAKRSVFQQLGTDLATKMILLTEKRIQVLSARIQDYLNVNRKYYAACAQVFTSIDTSAMKTENYNTYAFKALVQQKQHQCSTNGVPTNTPQPEMDTQKENWEELKQETVRAAETNPNLAIPQIPGLSADQIVQSPQTPQLLKHLQPVVTVPQVQPSWKAQQGNTPAHVPPSFPAPQGCDQSPMTNPQVVVYQGPPPSLPPPAHQSPVKPSSPQPALHQNPNQPAQPPPQWDQPQTTPTGVVLTRGGKAPTPSDLDFLI